MSVLEPYKITILQIIGKNMYNKINTLTNNLIDNYMSITNKKTIEKRKLSPSDYLMFRQEAINELENGIVDIDDADIRRDSINVNKTFKPCL